MSYRLVSVCALCAKETEFPMRTLLEVEQEIAVLLVRTAHARSAGAPDEMEVHVLCRECGAKPAPPGAAIVSGYNEVKVTPGEKH